MPQHGPSEHPGSSLGAAVQAQHDRAVADWLGGDYTSPAGDAPTLPGTGDGGTGSAAAAPAMPPHPDQGVRARARRRLARRIGEPADPSDVQIIAERIAQERQTK